MKITVEDKEYEVDEKDEDIMGVVRTLSTGCLLYTSPSPRDS